MRWIIRTSFPLAITISAPEYVAILAAIIFVSMPPVPTLLPVEAFPICINSSVRQSTRSINCASLFCLGSSVYKPLISDSNINKSAFVSAVTIAERVSFSPTTLSNSKVEMVSFSFTTGITPILNNLRIKPIDIVYDCITCHQNLRSIMIILRKYFLICCH